MDVSKMQKKKVLKKKKSKKDFRQPDDEDENQPKEVKAWWVSKEEQRPQTIENASTDYSNISLSFLTKQPQYAIPQMPVNVKENVHPKDLSKIVKIILKKAGNTEELPDFEFLAGGQLVQGPIGEHLTNLNISLEGTIQLEYFERHPPPTPKDNLEHDDWVSSVMSCGDWLVTGCYDNTVQLWSVDKEERGLGKRAHKLTIPAHKAPVKAVSWINTAERMKSFVSCSIDQTAIVWDWDSQNNSVECVWECRGHTQSIECVAVEPNGSRFITGSWDNMLKIWHAGLQSSSRVSDDDEEEEPNKKKLKRYKHERLKTPIVTLAGHGENVSGVAWVDSDQFLSCSWDHTIYLWDLNLSTKVSEINGNVSFFCISFSPLNRSVLAGCADRHIRLYDPRSKQGSIVKMKFTNHNKWVPTVRWSSTNENYFVSGSYDHTIRIWDWRKPDAPSFDLCGHDEKVLSVDWSHHKHVASGSADCTAQIYDIAV